MATVSVRLSDSLNDEVELMVEEGIFKDKTDAFHEAVRLLLKEYQDMEFDHEFPK
ncbi:MAG: type II toxin-antitoxin system ParD family antitoxin [Candidatus Nanohaloarchaea archaeon]